MRSGERLLPAVPADSRSPALRVLSARSLCIRFLRRLFEGMGEAITVCHHHMAHRTGFTEATLRRAVAVAGFDEINSKKGTMLDLWAAGVKPGPPPFNAQ